jgi:succinate dehydrogenase/fumarate reductase flavoprotein subunit
MTEKYDVIVIGGGGSGLAAGLSAAENGASVILFEKRPLLGGSTGIAVGSFTANGTVFQRRQGIDDSPADHDEDAGKFGPPEYQARNNGPLRRYFLEHSSATLDWLMDMGLMFYGPSPEPPNRVPRMHNVVPNAKAFIAVLQSRFLRSGGKTVCNATVEDLITENGRVTGVWVNLRGTRMQFQAARGVVLAAGDYTNSSQLISRYKGRRFADVEGINPHATGEGHVLAEKAGARLLNMDITYGPEIRFVPPPRKPFSQLLPAAGLAARISGTLLSLVPKWIITAMVKRLVVTWQHPEDALLEDGAILINSRGERFCNEKRSPEREIAIAAQPGKTAYILLDERVAERYRKWPHYISTAPEIAYAYVDDYLRLRPDITTEAGSLSGLSEMRKLPRESLEKTIADYNRYVSGRSEDPFGRRGDSNPVSEGRLVLLGPAKAYFTTTEGSISINTSFQALDMHGRPIEGLFAVGTCGMGGMILWGHGLHIAWAITSGRLLGEQLAQN